MLLHKSVEHDSRVRREARALAADGHDVTVLHLPRTPGELDGPLDGYRVLSVTPPAWVRRRLPFALYRLVFLAAFVSAARRLRPDAVHAHDAAMLAPGLIAAWLTRAALVYDSHEYAAGVPYRERAWAWLVSTLERLAVRRCAAIVTVSDGIADRLHDRHRLPRRPAVVRNMPDIAPHATDSPAIGLRERLGVGDAPLILHLGAAADGRGCPTLLRALARLPGAQLAFLGASEASQARRIDELSREAGVTERVHVLPPVPAALVVAHAREADVGVSLLEDTCENHRLALPNKVFEYLAAGLPVVASDLPELRRALGGRDGVQLCDPASPASVAAAIELALAGPRPAPEAAPSWPGEARVLRSLYGDLAGVAA